MLVLAAAMLGMGPPARAAGVALRWGSCQGTANRNFACDRSTGSELLVGSFDPPSGVNQLSGIEVVLRITSASNDAPSWWQMFANGSCRRTSVAASFDMSDQMECDDLWSGLATGGIALWQPDGSGINVKMVAAVAQNLVFPVPSGRTYAAFKLLINHSRSNGSGACSGCDVPVCIKLEAIHISQPGRLLHPGTGDPATEANYVDITNGLSGMGGASQVALWQGGTSSCVAGASKASTWSELKARFKPTR
jgi:hypothetical protein